MGHYGGVVGPIAMGYVDPVLGLFLALVLGVAVSLLWPHLFRIGAAYSVSDLRAVRSAFELVGIRGKRVYDLGCGTGEVLRMVEDMGGVGIGVEIDPVRWLICRLRVRGSKVILGNMYRVPLSDADVIYVFQWPSVNRRLAAKILNEARPGTIVVSYYWEMPMLTPIHIDREKRIYIYRVGPPSRPTTNRHHTPVMAQHRQGKDSGKIGDQVN